MSIQDQHEVQAQGEAVTSIRNNKNISEVSLVQDSKITKERFSPLLRQVSIVYTVLCTTART